MNFTFSSTGPGWSLNRHIAVPLGSLPGEIQAQGGSSVPSSLLDMKGNAAGQGHVCPSRDMALIQCAGQMQPAVPGTDCQGQCHKSG